MEIERQREIKEREYELLSRESNGKGKIEKEI